MFGSGSPSSSTESQAATANTTISTNSRSSPPSNNDKESRSRSGSSRASALIASAKSSLSSLVVSSGNEGKQKNTKSEAKEKPTTPPHNSSTGDSRPGPNSTFRVGVTEDRNKKCRRTMEDTHTYIYNFLQPTDTLNPSPSTAPTEETGITETDNGYFAIFDGHAGAYAADWCGKKLHLILEETIKKNPNTPIPELLDATFTHCDGQLEKLPMKNSGCTAVCAVLRWEDRLPNNGPNAYSANDHSKNKGDVNTSALSPQKVRSRVLYTANVGDARIVLCRNGEALRLSYDHKGSDENESRRVSNAGGLILNNRVNGVLAVTRALGDSYMKELVTGHPYTTETVIQPEDEFIILACDGLWDVCSDQEAVDLVRHVDDPQEASKILVNAALARFSSDNLSCMIVRLDHAKKEPTPSERTIPDAPEGAETPTGDQHKEDQITPPIKSNQLDSQPEEKEKQ